nr:nucleoside hydrolase [Bacillus bingmayongensis]
MTAEVETFYPEVHGTFGIGPIQPGLELKMFENFFEILKLIKQYKNELIIVNTGRLTSLATLFLLYGDMMKNVHSYYIMRGTFLYPGNVTPIAEANFYGDPVAANIVMRYAKNLSIYPLNVTQPAIVTPEMVNYIPSKGKAKLLKPLLDYYYYQFYQKKFLEVLVSFELFVLSYLFCSFLL